MLETRLSFQRIQGQHTLACLLEPVLRVALGVVRRAEVGAALDLGWRWTRTIRLGVLRAMRQTPSDELTLE